MHFIVIINRLKGKDLLNRIRRPFCGTGRKRYFQNVRKNFSAYLKHRNNQLIFLRISDEVMIKDK